MMTTKLDALDFTLVCFLGFILFFLQVAARNLAYLEFSFWSEVASRMKLDAPTNPHTPNGDSNYLSIYKIFLSLLILF